MKMLIVPVLGIWTLCAGAEVAVAKDVPVKLEELPAPVQKTMKEQSRGATVKGYKKEVEKGQTFYELETVVSGHTRDLLVDASGKIVEIETEVTIESVPASVKATIVKTAGKGKVTRIESVTKGDDKVEAYEVRVETAGKKSGFKVSASGKLMPKEHEKGEGPEEKDDD